MARVTLEAYVAELKPAALEDAIVRAAHASLPEHEARTFAMTPYHLRKDGFGVYHVTFFKAEEKK